MVVARLFPKNSTYFNKSKDYFIKLGRIMDSNGWMQLFPVWTLVVAGIVINNNYNDRYIYWEWSGWMNGSVKLLLVTFGYFLFLKPKQLWYPGKNILNQKEVIRHIIIAITLLFIGWVNLDSAFSKLPLIIPYCFAFVSCLMVFQFPLELDKEKGIWNHFGWHNKIEIFSISIICMIIALLSGIYFDDPILSTSAAVAFPFPFIALIWPNHVRHLQRARLFPLFTFSMFLCVRVPWFLIPLSILFFVVRTINFFRYGIVYPSFGVDFLEED